MPPGLEWGVPGVISPHGVAEPGSREADGGSGSCGAVGDVGAANTDARADAALAEVQANAWEEFNRAVKTEAHGTIVGAASGGNRVLLHITSAWLKFQGMPDLLGSSTDVTETPSAADVQRETYRRSAHHPSVGNNMPRGT